MNQLNQTPATRREMGQALFRFASVQNRRSNPSRDISICQLLRRMLSSGSTANE
jgi:hypothetical protein